MINYWDDLQKLISMRTRGEITEDEFQTRKKELLNNNGINIKTPTQQGSTLAPVSIAIATQAQPIPIEDLNHEKKQRKSSVIFQEDDLNKKVKRLQKENAFLKILSTFNLIGIIVVSAYILNIPSVTNFVDSIDIPDKQSVLGGESKLTQDMFTAPNDLQGLIRTSDESIFNVYCLSSEETGYGTSGTGWAIELNNGRNNDTYIVTNHHVIESCLDGRTIYAQNDVHGKVEAKIYASEGGFWDDASLSLRDIAVLKIITAKHNIAGLKLQEEPVQIGQWAIVIGYPDTGSGAAAYNHTTGTVSGFNELSLVITDAAVNKGNSGGPLLNSKGEVIATVFANNENSDYESLGFAQPLLFHCTVVFECMDNEILKDEFNTPLLYKALEVGQCLSYSVAGAYNLVNTDCTSDKIAYEIIEEIDLSSVTSESDIPECATKESSGVISEIVDGSYKAYCAIVNIPTS